MSEGLRYFTFDRALPLSESALAGADPHALLPGDLLAALLVTHLEGQGDAASAALVRAAMAKHGADRAHKTYEAGCPAHGMMDTPKHSPGNVPMTPRTEAVAQ